jgi:hypothetical protein
MYEIACISQKWIAVLLIIEGRQPGFPHYSAAAERLAQLVCGGS